MKYIMGVNWKLILVLVLVSSVFAFGISVMIMYAHNTATDEMQSDIHLLQKRMDCPNNACDRYKGADARRDLAQVYAEIEKLRHECAR